jgi:hypothetical protein
VSRQLTDSVESPNGRSEVIFSRRLAHLVLVPAYSTPRERLDAALGPELAGFLLAALTAQGRVGSSSPYVRT